MATLRNMMIKKLPRKRRAKVEARAAELIAEEMPLPDARKARLLKQTEVARQLQVGQGTASRSEKRSDLLLSTLGGFVLAVGPRRMRARAQPTRARQNKPAPLKLVTPLDPTKCAVTPDIS
jgi:hypothetical protein